MSGIKLVNDTGEYDTICSPAALAFIESIAAKFSARREALLDARREAQARLCAGALPGFLDETAEVRAGDWQVQEAPDVLQDRRVEITAPAERKKIIQALNCDARVFMADFEDALTPTWRNQMEGQLALYEAARGDCQFDDPVTGKHYQLDPNHSTVLFIRPRGWHLPEKNMHYDGRAIAGAFVDFGLFFFHNAKALAERGRGPFFYLPKIEHWREAELWEDIIAFAETEVGIAAGTAKVTLLIETLPAVFQMHEILHAMRNRIVGLNCGRWDYIFSYIKTLQSHPDRILPERGAVTMAQPLMNAYSLELIKTTHRRNAHAMGGMSAFLPYREDADATKAVYEKVRADKRRESQNGHDGTWVAIPSLVSTAEAVFNEVMPAANQKTVIPQVVHQQEDFLRVPAGDITLAGFDNNIEVSLRYLSSWLSGTGAVAIFNLMEDAATMEIARIQLWQWLRYESVAVDGVTLTPSVFYEALSRIGRQVAEDESLGDAQAHLDTAIDILTASIEECAPVDFMISQAYERL